MLLAEQGCGHQSLLVVSGAARGEVWTGFDFGLGGLVPEASDFASWYRRWLDDALFEWARGRLRTIALEGGATEDERRAVALVRPIVQARAAEPDVGPLQPGDARRALGDVRLLAGDPDAADLAYAEAAELTLHDPAAQLHLDRSRVRRATGRWDAALDEARAGLAAQPRSLGRRHELHTEAELALLGLGRRDEAIAAMEARAAADASYPDLHRRLARAQCAAGDLDGAHHTLLRALERSVGCYASPAEIGAALAAGEGMPKPPRERRVAEIYDAFVDALRGDDPASAAALAARRPGGS